MSIYVKSRTHNITSWIAIEFKKTAVGIVKYPSNHPINGAINLVVLPALIREAHYAPAGITGLFLYGAIKAFQEGIKTKGEFRNRFSGVFMGLAFAVGVPENHLLNFLEKPALDKAEANIAIQISGGLSTGQSTVYYPKFSEWNWKETTGEVTVRGTLTDCPSLSKDTDSYFTVGYQSGAMKWSTSYYIPPKFITSKPRIANPYSGTPIQLKWN